MRRALPAPPRMPRVERMRLQRERSERLRRRQASQLLAALMQQRAALLDPKARDVPMPEMRGLIAAARAATTARFQFGGRTFVVRRGFVFNTIHTPSGGHIVSFGGELFDA